ncbi:MAG: SurA N-terminal domain-containing protein [Alistipes sp.]|nr:SurA N-terminal domain-containing protein [Alistipes sp.]
MASLQTLRTKYGVVLSVIIVLALLAFIISLGPEMGFLGNRDPKVGTIDGEKVTYMEYLNEYETTKTNMGGDESSEEAVAYLANATWQSLVAKKVLTPGFEKMGLAVSEAERLSMLSGEHPSAIINQAFADPQTGVYDVAAVSSFLAQMSGNPQYQQMWAYINSKAVLNRLNAKFNGLIKAGTYVNKLEVEQGVAAENEARNGRLVVVNYNTVADSLATVSDAEILAYYNAHKEQDEYKKLPRRRISYVVFDVDPTESDVVEIENKARALGEEFAAADDVRTFVRKNMGTVAETYVSAAQLSSDEAVVLNGAQYGPVLKANEWVMSRPIATIMAPDSIGLSHIVLAPKAPEADSLYNALKGGANFAEAAAKHSQYAQTAQNGGDMGVVPFNVLSGELAEKLAKAKVGEIIKIENAGGIQIMKVTRADKPQKYAMVGTIKVAVEASSATRRNVHNVASIFSVDGKGSIDNFNTAAVAAAVTPRTATINQGDRTVSGLIDSREVARWAYGAEIGDLSEIFTVDGSYVVAMLTEIDDTKYVPVSEAQYEISRRLARDKKYEVLKAQLAGASIEEIAAANGVEVTTFENVKYGDFGVGSNSYEPALVGAIAKTAETGSISAPVKGSSVAAVFVVDGITKSEEQTAEAEKVRLQAFNETLTQQMAAMALQRMIEIEDLRGKYF